MQHLHHYRQHKQRCRRRRHYHRHHHHHEGHPCQQRFPYQFEMFYFPFFRKLWRRTTSKLVFDATRLSKVESVSRDCSQGSAVQALYTDPRPTRYVMCVM